MLRRCLVLLGPALAAASNEYQLIATDKICPDAGRIALPCGSCGPAWGDTKVRMVIFHMPRLGSCTARLPYITSHHIASPQLPQGEAQFAPSPGNNLAL
jgi:hypothetical protein